MVRAWVDLEKRIAGFHLLALSEEDLGNPTIYPSLDRHPIKRLDGAEAFDVNRDIVLPSNIGGYRNCWQLFALLSFGVRNRFETPKHGTPDEQETRQGDKG